MTSLPGAEAHHPQLIADLWDLVRLMVGVASPPGRERLLAEALADVGRRRCPELTWWVDPVDDDTNLGQRANLIVSGGAQRYEDLDIVLLAHLDTSLANVGELSSLTGDDLGQGDIAGALIEDGPTVRAPGLGIAKGPAAAALAALVQHRRQHGSAEGVAVMLTCGGTHRVDPERPGAQYALGLHHARRHGFQPRLVVNVKAGAPGVLYEEPGSHALRLTVRCPSGHTMMRARTGPGAVVGAAAAIAVLERWRSEVVALPTSGQTGRDVGVGAVRAGLCDKADLLPGVATVDAYLVATPDDDVDALIERLQAHLVDDETLRGLGVTADVRLVSSLAAGRTAPDHPLVRLAETLWTRHVAPLTPITGWRGSTDGALVRSWGIPTVRLGPQPQPAPPGFEALDRRQLETFAHLHAELLHALTSRSSEVLP